MLQALDIAVKTMELNELANFLSTSKYAYGKLGVPELVGEGIIFRHFSLY